MSNVSNAIQSLDPTGFTVGTSPQVNFVFVTYHWVAWKTAPGEMKVGTYTGNGAGSQSIAGLGFSPDIVFVLSGRRRPARAQGERRASRERVHVRGVLSTNYIPTLGTDGFTVGNDVRVNRTGDHVSLRGLE